jgi:hypothetical protein
MRYKLLGRGSFLLCDAESNGLRQRIAGGQFGKLDLPAEPLA